MAEKLPIWDTKYLVTKNKTEFTYQYPLNQSNSTWLLVELYGHHKEPVLFIMNRARTQIALSTSDAWENLKKLKQHVNMWSSEILRLSDEISLRHYYNPHAYDKCTGVAITRYNPSERNQEQLVIEFETLNYLLNRHDFFDAEFKAIIQEHWREVDDERGGGRPVPSPSGNHYIRPAESESSESGAMSMSQSSNGSKAESVYFQNFRMARKNRLVVESQDSWMMDANEDNANDGVTEELSQDIEGTLKISQTPSCRTDNAHSQKMNLDSSDRRINELSQKIVDDFKATQGSTSSETEYFREFRNPKNNCGILHSQQVSEEPVWDLRGFSLGYSQLSSKIDHEPRTVIVPAGSNFETPEMIEKMLEGVDFDTDFGEYNFLH